VTAKEALRDYIDELSDEEALSLWQRIQCEESEPPAPLTEGERAAIERGLADTHAGRTFSLEDVESELGIAR